MRQNNKDFNERNLASFNPSRPRAAQSSEWRLATTHCARSIGRLGLRAHPHAPSASRVWALFSAQILQVATYSQQAHARQRYNHPNRFECFAIATDKLDVSSLKTSIPRLAMNAPQRGTIRELDRYLNQCLHHPVPIFPKFDEQPLFSQKPIMMLPTIGQLRFRDMLDPRPGNALCCRAHNSPRIGTLYGMFSCESSGATPLVAECGICHQSVRKMVNSPAGALFCRCNARRQPHV